jgi:excisionase family DNA binding protein
MAQQILDPASEAEAELAGTATACLMTALDHSKAEVIKVTIDVDGEGDGEPPVLLLPPRALHFFAAVLRQMAKREPMLLMPQKLELTTQEAAAFLNVSRPFVIKEIEEGRLKYRLVNRHRRIEFEEVKRYQAQQKHGSEEALRDLNRLSEDIGQDL